MNDTKLRILLVVYDNGAHISRLPLNVAYLASAARDAGHDVSVYNQDVYHYPDAHLTEYLNNNKFDVIGMGACGGYYQYRKIKSLCQAVISSTNKPFLVGGGHLVSPDPEFFLRKFGFDALCIGEGEVTFVDLLDAICTNRQLNEVDGIAFLDTNGECVTTKSRPLIEDIDSISMPAYDLFPMEHHALMRMPNIEHTARLIPMLSGRGCIFECNFCYRMDKGWRIRSAENILEEVEFLMRNYAISHILFDDELLMGSVSRTRELCEKFIASGLSFKWGCNGRLNFATPDLLELMKKAGCVFINYGIESVNDDALRTMNKNMTVNQIVAGIEATLAVGISPGFNIIFGNIGETAECLKNDVDFLLKYDDHGQLRTIRPVTPYPGSPLFDYACQKGLIKDVEDFYENKHTNSDLLTVNFTDMSNDEFYEALFQANRALLNSHIEHIKKTYDKLLTDLYKNLNADFRGFRHT